MDFFGQLESLIKSQQPDQNSAREVLAQLGASSVSIAILQASQISSTVIGNPSYNSETLFQAASISKPITALAVIKLAQQGILDLDIPISTYLDDSQMSLISKPENECLVSRITLKMLLSHRSGLSVHSFAGYTGNTSDLPSLSQILAGHAPANNAKICLEGLPGQNFCYSGGGYTVIQLILETVLHKPFVEIMEEVVLGPLEMARSSFRYLSPTEDNWAAAHLTGFVEADPPFHVFPESAAAGLWTTPSDLLRAVAAVQRSLVSDDFLEKKWAELMLAEVEESGMALGWVATVDGIGFGHGGGNVPGYGSYFMGYATFAGVPDGPKSIDDVPKNCGVCVMTDSVPGPVALDKMAAAIIYLKEWPMEPYSLGLDAALIPFFIKEATPDARGKEWVGEWESWTITYHDGLWLTYTDFPEIALLPAAISPKEYIQGRSLDYVAQGLEIMVRLGWKDEIRVVELWQSGGVTILESTPK